MSKAIFGMATAIIFYGVLRNFSVEPNPIYMGTSSAIGPYVLGGAGYCAAIASKLIWS